MGCSYDVIRAKVRVEDKETFIDMFNKVMEDDLYDDSAHADMNCFSDTVEDGRVEFGIDQEPLFKIMEDGAPFFDFLCKYLYETKDNGFTAEYECTFNNCAAMVISEYSYEEDVLTVRTKRAEEGYLMCCTECGYEDEDGEDLITLHDWEEGKELTCPECGAVLELEDAMEETEEVNVVEYCEEVYFEAGDVRIVDINSEKFDCD